jgi:hypothetical protein
MPRFHEHDFTVVDTAPTLGGYFSTKIIYVKENENSNCHKGINNSGMKPNKNKHTK